MTDYEPLTEEEQINLFGCPDPFPPVAGSARDEAGKLYRKLGSTPAAGRVIKATWYRMRSETARSIGVWAMIY